MNSKDYLNKIVEVKIDRPFGSKHPKHGFLYPVNYGYVPNTVSADGEELDCYILGVFEPLEEFTGKCIAIIHRTDDNDDKLIIVPDDRNFTDEEIEVLVEFQERFFKHIIVRDDIVFNSLIPELSVSNIDNSREFYLSLGFKVIYERKEDRFLFLTLDDNQIMLEEVNDNWSVGKLSYPYGNGINISMMIKDIDTLYDNIKKKDIKLFRDLKVDKYRVDDRVYEDKEFLIQDPDGYLLRFND